MPHLHFLLQTRTLPHTSMGTMLHLVVLHSLQMGSPQEHQNLVTFGLMQDQRIKLPREHLIRLQSIGQKTLLRGQQELSIGGPALTMQSAKSIWTHGQPRTPQTERLSRSLTRGSLRMEVLPTAQIVSMVLMQPIMEECLILIPMVICGLMFLILLRPREAARRTDCISTRLTVRCYGLKQLTRECSRLATEAEGPILVGGMLWTQRSIRPLFLGRTQMRPFLVQEE